jgi:hypothetical protein
LISHTFLHQRGAIEMSLGDEPATLAGRHCDVAHETSQLFTSLHDILL